LTDNQRFRQFERRNRRVLCYRREIVQEFVKILPALQVV